MQNGHALLIAALEESAWPAKAAAELARGAHIVPYERRSTIFHAGEAADLVYLLLSGEVKLQFEGGESDGLLVSIARGGVLGVFAPDGGPSGERPEQLFTAEALSRCRVAIIPTARVAHVLHQLPTAQLVRVLERGREQWMRLSCRLLTYLTMSVRERLLHAIGELADAFGISDARGRVIALRLSHDDFAALVGASRPMVSKHLKDLVASGLLAKHQGRYVLLAQGGREAEAEARGRAVIGLGEARQARGARALRGAKSEPGAPVREGPLRSA
ncbi:MAG: Crp/Fnr family transcriptional regulator [Deltaproteobacteria bacterium]|nr:Crp/Fnr family transcriptional regulator [Deltaproteobacteria bacterium]